MPPRRGPPAPMVLEVPQNEDPYGGEMDLSESGRFSAGDFQIKPQGIVGLTRGGGGLVDCEYKDLEIGCRLGRGASSIVYYAEHRPTGGSVALKTMPIAEHASRHQLVNELRTLRSINNSDHLVKLYNAFSIDGDIAIALEYMDGGSLEGLLKIGALPEVVLQSIAIQIVQGLLDLHAHKHIHRDLKPANIMLGKNGCVKITDFGITRQLVTDEYAQTFVGTTVYMSPERIQNAKYGVEADVWSLGMILLEAAQGLYPYPCDLGVFDLMQRIVHGPAPIEDFFERAPHPYSRDFIDLIECCLTKDPGVRYDTAQIILHPWLRNFRPDARAMDDVRQYLIKCGIR